MATSPQIELRIGRSPSKYYAAARLRASAFAGYAEQTGGGFVLRAAVGDLRAFALRELAEIVRATWAWTSSAATVDGAEISRFTLASALCCWATKLKAKPRAQARHCLPPAPSTPRRTVPESQTLPCRVCVVEGARWADFAPGGITDHAALEAQIKAAASAHPVAWCPGFDVTPALVQVRKLPRSRATTRAREERAAAKAEAEWRAHSAEMSRQLRAALAHQDEIAWLERTIERAHIDRGANVLTSAEWERIADILHVPELRLLPDVGSLTDVQRRGFAERLRELLVSNPPDE